jgi:hypothetical protein
VCHNPEDHDLNFHCHENLISLTLISLYLAFIFFLCEVYKINIINIISVMLKILFC